MISIYPFSHNTGRNDKECNTKHGDSGVEAFMLRHRVDYQPYWILYAYALGVEPYSNRVKSSGFSTWIRLKHERYRAETLHSQYASDYVQKFIEWLNVRATEEHEQGKAP